MTKASLMVAVCATLLWAGTALATVIPPTPQQRCNSARITAWKVYTSCLDTVVARDYLHETYGAGTFVAYAKCRHTYFKKWAMFQTVPALATSTCRPVGGARFTDNGMTVTDGLTGLVWEKKTTDGSVHDVNNRYMWSSGSNNEDGTAFTDFLVTLNSAGFAGANGWRLPTLAELQSILLDFACTGAGGATTCTCGASPCIDAAFGPTAPTDSVGGYYWSATTHLSNSAIAWIVETKNAYIGAGTKNDTWTHFWCRAVRGGL
jgi:hypothetical protein